MRCRIPLCDHDTYHLRHHEGGPGGPARKKCFTTEFYFFAMNQMFNLPVRQLFPTPPRGLVHQFGDRHIGGTSIKPTSAEHNDVIFSSKSQISFLKLSNSTIKRGQFLKVLGYLAQYLWDIRWKLSCYDTDKSLLPSRR